mmetsp:Transcript_27558/g.49699  ORF Transcript_27558/g.49699 Transcript_27558/m.49699 type:complete len:148 (-) Transcript_27558:35-478(-)
MIAYAYYKKHYNLKVSLIERLHKYIEENSIDLDENLILLDFLAEIGTSIGKTHAIMGDLQIQMPQKQSVDQSCVVFENDPDFKLDEEVLLREARRVLGSQQDNEEARREIYKQAYELLGLALEENPENIRVSALYNEVLNNYLELID